MDLATLLARDLAAQMIAQESSGDESSEAQASAALRACDKLCLHLSRVIGTGGYIALASRALALSRAERGILPTVHISENGSLRGFSEVAINLEPIVAQTDAHSIVTQQLSLLLVFIGEALTVQIVRSIWPDLPLRVTVLGSEDVE